MSHVSIKRVNPYTEVLTALQWGVGSGVILAACFGMAQDMLSSIGVNISCRIYTGAIVGAIVALLFWAVSHELRALFTSVLITSCALIFSMVQHQFAGDPLIITSIIFVHVILIVACVSLEKVWH